MQFSTVKDNPKKSRKEISLPENGNPIPALKNREEIHFPDIPGFGPIPIARIGLYLDEFRQSLPKVEDRDVSGEGAVFDSMKDIEHTNQKEGNAQ